MKTEDTLLPNLDIDHIGVVVKSISDSVAIYEALGYQIETEVIFVKSQKINCQYFKHKINHIRIQLIEPTNQESPVYNALLKGGGVNHICYSCDDIDMAIQESKKIGCKVVVEPFRGEGVNNRRAAFLFHPALGITEIVEKN